MKPITPYERLKRAAARYLSSTHHAHQVFMWRYSKNRLHEGWALRDLYDRVAAADSLGYDVKLVANEDGLAVFYRKRADSIELEMFL